MTRTTSSSATADGTSEGIQRGGEGRGDRQRLCQEVLPDLHRPDWCPHDGGGSRSRAQDRDDHDGQEASYHHPLPVQETKDKVLANRRKLKGKGVSVAEDHTAASYKLARDAYKQSYTLASWSSQGKVYAKLKNGKTLQ